MKIDHKVPFFSNTPDDTHCFQAGIRMILKYFYPEENYSWEELDKITQKIEGLWTWPIAGFLWLQNKGLQIKVIEHFDYQRFIDEGEDYLIKYFGPEVAKEQVAHSDIPRERKLLRDGIDQFNIEKRIANLQDIKRLLQDGCLISCSVNSKALNNKQGYVGHFVVIKGIDDDELIIHDPGLPPQENRHVSLEQFEKAWAYSGDKTKALTAFKKTNIQKN